MEKLEVSALSIFVGKALFKALIVRQRNSYKRNILKIDHIG